MSVLLTTSVGEIVVDLFIDQCPVACENFLKLCKIKYYNGCLIYNVQPNLLIQTGDPSGSGRGGRSIYGLLEGTGRDSFKDEICPERKFNRVGLVGMAHFGEKENSNKSQFFITLRGNDLEYMEKKYTIFGEVAEGLSVLEILNNLYCDADCRPYQDVRITHTYILDDPFDDPPNLQRLIPPASPDRTIPSEEVVKSRIAYEDSLNSKLETIDGRTQEEIELSIKQKEAKSRAIVLEMTGDLPDADVKPPDEVLFVCKLNPVTTDEDLELIFSRFGTIKSCEVIRDFKTGDSLNYAFIEFETEAAAIEAYDKMNNVLIDDRRIKVDFSQSVSKLWNRFIQKPRNTVSSSLKATTAITQLSGGNRQEHHDSSRDRVSAAGGGGGGSRADRREGDHRSYNRRNDDAPLVGPPSSFHRDRVDNAGDHRDHGSGGSYYREDRMTRGNSDNIEHRDYRDRMDDKGRTNYRNAKDNRSHDEFRGSTDSRSRKTYDSSGDRRSYNSDLYDGKDSNYLRSSHQKYSGASRRDGRDDIKDHTGTNSSASYNNKANDYRDQRQDVGRSREEDRSGKRAKY
jgi:peptidyl-prolyl cis-trans isomerase-like 4